jgi:hypothetical protein
VVHHRDLQRRGGTPTPGSRVSLRAEEAPMRGSWPVSLVAACAALAGCGPPPLDCEADAVRRTLTSMARTRVVQVVGDSLPPRAHGAGRAALAAATRISIEAPRLVLWEKTEGRLSCVADVVVEAPVGARRSVVKARTQIHYRVMGGHADAFMVEIAYADLMSLFEVPDTAPTPSPPRR